MAMPLERSTEDLRAALSQSAQSGTIGVKGIGGGARAWFLAHLLAETHQPLLAVLPTEEEAERLAADLRFFQTHAKALGIPEAVSRAICLFPPWELLPYESITPDPLLSGARLEALHLLRSDPEPVLFASLKALLPRLLPPDVLEAGTQKVAVGRALRLEEFLAALARSGYRKVPLVSQVGDFSRRGHILDVFTPGQEGPYRIELFGEEVEEIRLFDVDTQRSLARLEEALILPTRELPEDLSPRDLPLRPLSTFRDHLSPDTILLLVEPDQLQRQAERQAEAIRRGHAEEALGSAAGGFPSPWDLYLSPDELWSALGGQWPAIRILLDELGASLPPTRRRRKAPFATLLAWESRSADTLDVRVGPRRPLARVAEKIKSWEQQCRVFLTAPNEGHAARLREILEAYGVERVTYLVGPLSRGFLLEQERTLILTEEEIFGERVHPPSPPKRSRLSRLVSTFHALRAGDYVVHVEHGIAEYLGLQHLQVGGLEGDFLVLRFEGNDRLYVPPDKIDLVQKYAGPEGHRPRLDRLGGKAWERT
ncbi:MAG: hypothetical protein HZA23_00290 [Nitrospirae bacterium]|nr:hypothetical protein [Nitrospirota bacterium]